MGMDQQLLTGVIGAGLVDPEDVRALVVKRAVCNQLVDRAPWQKSGIKLEQRLRPELSRIQCTLYGVRNTRIRNFDETARVTGVIAHETITEIENVHGCAPRTHTALAVSLTCQEPAPSSRSPQTVTVGWSASTQVMCVVRVADCPTVGSHVLLCRITHDPR